MVSRSGLTRKHTSPCSRYHLSIRLETAENHEYYLLVRLQPVTSPLLKPSYLPKTNLAHQRYTDTEFVWKHHIKKLTRIQVRESKAGRPEYKADLVIALPCRSVQNNLVNVESNPRLPGAMYCSLLSRVWQHLQSTNEVKSAVHIYTLL
jgi:hypothetical protein